MRKINLGVTDIVVAVAVAVSFMCVGCNDGGVESGGGDAEAYLKSFKGSADGDGVIVGKYDYSLSCGNRPCNKKSMPDGKVWMTENLNYKPLSGNSRCYNDSDSYCDKYGRLYDWATAMGIAAKYNYEKWTGGKVKWRGICPTGWHLPSIFEWRNLVDSVGSPAGTILKSEDGWDIYNGKNGGTNDFGFSALPGGWRNGINSYSEAGTTGFWWAASGNSDFGESREMPYDDSAFVTEYSTVKYLGMSVRCLQD
jgi:uncharacterized protein (TIGR02145 family)